MYDDSRIHRLVNNKNNAVGTVPALLSARRRRDYLWFIINEDRSPLGSDLFAHVRDVAISHPVQGILAGRSPDRFRSCCFMWRVVNHPSSID
jgi:hypothetical protein